MYRPPGTYARFVRTVSPVTNAGNSRIMAIAGTGINYYTVENEAITKSNTKPYDTLQNSNVFEIMSVSSRPIYNGLITSNNTIYYPSTETQKGYTVNNNIISWDSLVEADITVDYKNCPDFYVYTNNGTVTYNIEYSVDDTALYPVEDGNFMIEVSYINEDDIDATTKLGCYRIINADTSEIIGEYVVSDKVVTNEDGTYPIPGVRLVVKNTYIKDMDSNRQKVFVGDYIKLHTVAAKTETEATAYKYNLKDGQSIDNLKLAVSPQNDTENPVKLTSITTTFSNNETIPKPYTLSNKYKLYIKTSDFEKADSDSFTTEDLGKLYTVAINGKDEYTFNENELNTITGLTDAMNYEYQVTVKYDTRKPTQREINNKTYGQDTEQRTIITATFAWNEFDATQHYEIIPIDQDGNEGKAQTFSKATYTVAIASFIYDETSKEKTNYQVYEENQNLTNVKLVKYNYKTNLTGTNNNDITVYYDRYVSDTVSGIISATNPDDMTNFSIKIKYDTSSNAEEDTSDTNAQVLNKSSLYNENTAFYILGCALDDNGNVLDYAYASTMPNVVSNMATTDGTNIVSGFNSIDNNDNEYAGTITAYDKNINMVISMLTNKNATSDEGNGSLYSAISDITIISNEQLNQISSVYKVEIVTLNDIDYFRIVRYVNGQEDLTFTDYNGNLTDATLGTDTIRDVINDMGSGGTKVLIPQRLYEIEPDGEVFDIIPGVTFHYDTTMSPNIPNGSSTLIITSPRITSNDIPSEGSTYYVSYKYRKADADYEPKFFDDYDDIVVEYGNYDVSASSAVLNSLSLGAEIAFNNGVSQIVCVQARNNSDYEMQSAIDRLGKSIAGANNVATVIPLSASDSVGAYLKNHVDLMSSYDYGKERMGYLGARINQQINKIATKEDRSLGMTSIAAGYDDERIVYVVPGAIKKQIRDLRTGRYNERTLPGCYAAVAVAAIGLANDPAEPLTYKTISGFTQLVDLYSESEKNQLAQAGCCVLEQNGNTIRIRHGITTCDDDVNSQEITLIQIKDYVIDACRTITADTYIGRKLTQTLIADIKYTMENLLNNFMSQGVIINYTSLKVKRSTLDPRQVDVSFEIEAVYPLNWINIEFGFSAVS